MKKLSLLLISFMCCTALLAQDSLPIKHIETSYRDYFKLHPETIYTHLNKSKIFIGEEIWFKSYVYDKSTHKPYLSTKNIHVCIYNEDGKLINNKIFYCNNGMTYGNFKITEAFQPGIYFVKTTTNWMRNFNEENSDIKKIEILGSKNDDIAIKSSETVYDLQLLPEGGHLINNAKNTIGVKIINQNGKGEKFVSGRVFNAKNNTIAYFKLNAFGIGKFDAFLNNKNNYFIEATLENGEVIKQQLPKTSTKGVNLSVKNHGDTMYVVVRTNKETLASLVDKKYALLVHRDGIINSIEINFKDKITEYILTIDKKNLYPGINIFTLINHKEQPISERIVFNEKRAPIKSFLKVAYVVKEKDTTTVIMKRLKKDTINTSLSASVLPKNTKTYTFKDNILTSFLLESYVRGQIENPSYYFNSITKKTMQDLDLLLLTQGWSRYSWKNIFHKPQIEIYNFETGFQVNGNLIKPIYDSENHISFVSKENNLFLTSSIENQNTFYFNNLFLQDSSNITLSYQNKDNKPLKAIFYFNITPKRSLDSLDTSGFIKNYIKTKTPFEPVENIILDDTVILNEVELEYTKAPGLPKPKNRTSGSFYGKNIKLTDRYHPLSLVTDVIRNNHYDVYNDGINVNITTSRIQNLSGSEFSPIVFINNIRINNLNDLATLRVSEIDEMVISGKHSAVYGSAGAAGVINIYSKKNFGNTKNYYDKFKEYDVPFGFSTAKEYYSPLYITSKSLSFSKYGVNTWIPNIAADSNGDFLIKFPNLNQESVTLFIEGMSSDGSLFSKEETINITN